MKHKGLLVWLGPLGMFIVQIQELVSFTGFEVSKTFL